MPLSTILDSERYMIVCFIGGEIRIYLKKTTDKSLSIFNLTTLKQIKSLDLKIINLVII